MDTVKNYADLIEISNNNMLKAERINIFKYRLPETDMLTKKDILTITSILCESNVNELSIFVSKSRERILIALESLFQIGVLPPFIFKTLEKMYNINTNCSKIQCFGDSKNMITLNVYCGCSLKIKPVQFNSINVFCSCYIMFPFAKISSKLYKMENYVTKEDLYKIKGIKLNQMLSFDNAFFDVETISKHDSLLGLTSNRIGYEIVKTYDIKVDEISENLYCICDFGKYAYSIATSYIPETQMYCMCVGQKHTSDIFDCKSMLSKETGGKVLTYNTHEYLKFNDFAIIVQLTKLYIRKCCQDHQSIVTNFILNKMHTKNRRKPSAAFIIFLNIILESIGPHETKTNCYPKHSIIAYVIDFLDSGIDITGFIANFIEIFMLGMTNVSIKMLANSPSILIGGLILCFWDIQNTLINQKLINVDIKLNSWDFLFYYDGLSKPSNEKRLENIISLETHKKIQNDEYLIYNQILKNDLNVDNQELNYFFDAKTRGIDVDDEIKRFCHLNNINI